MKFTFHDIGNYRFVVFDEYAVSLNDTCSFEETEKNLLDNYNRIKIETKNENEAKQKFISCLHAKHRPDWVNYQYKVEQVSLLEDMGYKVIMPLLDGFGNKVELKMHYWKENEEGVFYSIYSMGDPRGTIIHDTNESVKEFFERFVSEVFYFTTVQTQDYFPFVKDVRSQFNFRPALYVVGGYC